MSDKWKLKPVGLEDLSLLSEYFAKRPSGICENAVFDTYLWQNYYRPEYIKKENFLFFLLHDKEEIYTVMPLCERKYCKEAFQEIQNYFTKKLEKKLFMDMVDEEMLELLELPKEKYEITTNRDYYDYIYEGKRMAGLSGRKLHKKKNHLNAFMREYGDCSYYKSLTYDDAEDIITRMDTWLCDSNEREEDIYAKAENEGFKRILKERMPLDFKMGGIYVHDKLEAFAAGSMSPNLDMCYIHIEKANPSIRGLYTAISSWFIKHEYPEVSLVNREDDMGLMGLRHSKESYQPIELISKYQIREK